MKSSKKNVIYYILDDNNVLYSYNFGGLLSPYLCDLSFKYFCKKYPNKQFYKIRSDLISILENICIDNDYLHVFRRFN